LLLVNGVFKGAAAGDALRYRAFDSCRFQFGARCAEYGLRRPEAIEKFPGGAGAEARDQR
jgi:hypothetical protein